MAEPSDRGKMLSHADIAAVNYEFADYKLSAPLREALLTSPLVQGQLDLDWAALKDMLCDVVMLTSPSGTIARDALRRYVVRHKDKHRSYAQSTRIDLLHNNHAKSFPIEDKFAMIVETAKENHYLVAPNHFQLWAWVRAFQTAMDGTAAQVCVFFLVINK